MNIIHEKIKEMDSLMKEIDELKDSLNSDEIEKVLINTLEISTRLAKFQSQLFDIRKIKNKK